MPTLPIFQPIEINGTKYSICQMPGQSFSTLHDPDTKHMLGQWNEITAQYDFFADQKSTLTVTPTIVNDIPTVITDIPNDLAVAEYALIAAKTESKLAEAAMQNAKLLEQIAELKLENARLIAGSL